MCFLLIFMNYTLHILCFIFEFTEFLSLHLFNLWQNYVCKLSLKRTKQTLHKKVLDLFIIYFLKSTFIRIVITRALATFLLKYVFWRWDCWGHRWKQLHSLHNFNSRRRGNIIYSSVYVSDSLIDILLDKLASSVVILNLLLLVQNIVQRIWSFSQMTSESICILSASGTISSAEIFLPASGGGVLRYEAWSLL